MLLPDEAHNMTKIFYLSKSFLTYIQQVNYFDTTQLFVLFNSIIAYFNTGTFNTSILLEKAEFFPQILYIPLRFCSIFFGVGAVLVIYFIGLIFSPIVAILSSSFLAVSVLHIKYSQIFLPYSGMCFFTLLSTLCLLKSKTTNSEKLFVLSIVFSFLSSSFHLIGLISIIPIFLFCGDLLSIKRLKSIFIIYFSLFSLLNINFIFHFFDFIRYLFKTYIDQYNIFPSSSHLLYLISLIPVGVGPVVYLTFFFLFKYKNEYDNNLLKILFSVPLLCLAFIGFFHLTEASYGVLLVPYICLGSALVFAALFKNKDEKARFVFILLILFALWIPLKYTMRYNKLLRLSDTRVLASEWIRENTTENYRVVWDKHSIQLNWFDAYNKHDLLSLGIDKESLINKQQFTITKKFLKQKKWFQTLRKKTDYVVVNSLDIKKAFHESGHDLEKKYYKKILKLKPIVVFDPNYIQAKLNRKCTLEELYSPLKTLWKRERMGPVVKIYEL